MFCVACMTFANYVAATVTIALAFILRKKTMQERIRTCVLLEMFE